MIFGASGLRRRGWADGALIALFAVLLALPTLDWLAGLDPAPPPFENRRLARKPNLFGPAGLGLGHQASLDALNDYFADHFGFRNSLLAGGQQLRLRLFHDQGAGVPSVLRGQDGWLFYKGDYMIEQYLDLYPFTPDQLQAWGRLLATRRDWLAARGIVYLFVIAPDKQDIYPEKLPGWLAARESKLDQLLSYLHTHSTVPVLDLRPALLAAKASAPVYLQNDSHWNALGCLVACQEVVKALTNQIPGIAPLRREDFSWTNAPATGGDLARMLAARWPESNYYAFVPEPATRVPRLEPATTAPGQILIAENPARQVTALVLHDSFGATWPPFLGCCFQRIEFRWGNNWRPQTVIAAHPQVVIDEMAERFVKFTDPAALRTGDGPTP